MTSRVFTRIRMGDLEMASYEEGKTIGVEDEPLEF